MEDLTQEHRTAALFHKIVVSPTHPLPALCCACPDEGPSLKTETLTNILIKILLFFWWSPSERTFTVAEFGSCFDFLFFK